MRTTYRVAVLALASCCSSPVAAARAQALQWLVTANENKVELIDGVSTVRASPPPDNVTLFDIAGAVPRLVAQVDVPVSVAGPPQSVVLAPDLTLALVTAATRVDPTDPTKLVDGAQIAVLDLEASPPAVVQTLAVGPAPAAVAITPNGSLALAVTRTDSSVLVFTLQNKRLQQIARLALPEKSVPGGLAIAPDGKRALVTRDGDSTVTVLNIEGNNVTLAGRDFFTGLRPYSVQIAPNGEWAIVGNVGRGQGDADTITLVDLKGALPRSLHHASVGPSVEGVAISRDSKLIAAVVQNGSNRVPTFPFYAEHGYVVLLRVDDGKLVTLGSAPIGKWSQGAAFSADSRVLYVQNMVERDLQIFRVDRIRGKESLDTHPHKHIRLPGGGAAITVGFR
jgi:DNA-binding beta-propeller fold protein YncE